MSDTHQNQVRISFHFFSELLGEETTERLWASVEKEEEGLYRIESTPFYAPLVATGDLVYANYENEEHVLVYQKTIEYSGNSTIQVILMDESKKIEELTSLFRKLGCLPKSANESFFVMEIPSEVDYAPIRRQLEELEKGGTIFYAEPCLSPKHRY
jgi:Domain of unknown function (DUF4265)